MNGLILVDKPGGITSHDVLIRLRRATGEKQTGHLGTLDPMATGVLPVLAGKFTRLAQFFGPLEKTYTGTIRFGFSTDTYDAEGAPTSPSVEIAFSRGQLEAAAARFEGRIDQMPPPYSAKKVRGKRAYAAAREGKPLVLTPVEIMVGAFRIGSFTGDSAAFSMRISSGGYVRSIAHDLGQALGTGAHLAALRRTRVGPFTVEEALPLDELCRLAEAGELERRLPHPRSLLPELPSTTADPWSAGRLRNGMQVNLPEFSRAPLVKIFSGQRDLVAIGRRVAGTLFQPIAVLA